MVIIRNVALCNVEVALSVPLPINIRIDTLVKRSLRKKIPSLEYVLVNVVLTWWYHDGKGCKVSRASKVLSHKCIAVSIILYVNLFHAPVYVLIWKPFFNAANPFVH